MFFAVIGDILSNFRGLQAISARIAEEGIYRIVHTGNLGLEMPEAARAMHHLRERRVIQVAGELDRTVVKRARNARGAVGAAPWPAKDIEFLACLPRVQVFTEEGLRICVCHGSVNSARDRLAGHTPLAKFQRQRELAQADVVVCGGAEEPFHRMVADVLFVSAGHMSPQPGRARWIVVQTETRPWSASIREVRYESAPEGVTA